MKPVNGKNKKRRNSLRRILLGLGLGSAIGFVASYVAGSTGSQCFILCNQAVAVPYFAAVGFLVSWR